MYRLTFLFFLLVFALVVRGQSVISGVVSNEAGQPLPGVMVRIYAQGGSQVLAFGQTNKTGHYRLEVKTTEAASLTVRYAHLSYKTVEARLPNAAAHHDVQLTERVVSHVTEMERFIRIRPGIFDHNALSGKSFFPVVAFRTVLDTLSDDARKDRKRSRRFIELNVYVRACCKEFADGRYGDPFERRFGIDNMHDALSDRGRSETEKFCIGEHRNADIAPSGIGRSLQRQSFRSDSGSIS